jgi:hypothetical protein
MEESQTNEGHRATTASGSSSEPSPPVSLHARRRLRERTPSPRREWRRGEARWHRARRTQEQEMPAGPRPFLPATGPRPFLSASVLLGRPDPSSTEARQGPVQGPPARETPMQALPPPGCIDQPLTNTDLQTNMAIQDLQADCPLCNCLTLQRGDQRRCMMFPWCPFNWRVGWTPYW